MKKLYPKMLIVLILLILPVTFLFTSFSADTSSQDSKTQTTEITSTSGITIPTEITSTSVITSPAEMTSTSAMTSPAETASLVSAYIDNNKCFYSINENGTIKYFQADYINQAIMNPVEIKRPIDEKKIPGSTVTLRRPLSIDGYLKGYVALKNESEQRKSVAYYKKDFSKHMDLFELELSAEEAIDLIYVTKDFRYFFYIQKSKDITQLMAYDLVQNQKIQVSESGKYYIVEQKKDRFYFYQVNLQMDSKQPVLEKIEVNDLFYSDKTQSVKANGYDTVIQNGIVMDPETETMKFGYNVGILQDKISVITKQTISGRKKIDATGLIVSPGFIDMLAFNVTATAAKYKIADGVTTSLSMHGCTANFGGFFNSYGRTPPLVNYGGALFEVKLRRELGIGDYSKPNKNQIDIMVKRTRQEIEKGAIAIAFSPEYYPGVSPEEIKAIMKVAKEYNVPTHFHGRYSALSGEHTGIDTVEEILGYAKELNAPVHFMHLHSCGGTGCMDEALQMIDDARAQGYKVTYDIYPYDSWASRLNMARFRGDWQDRFQISFPDLQIPAKERGMDANSFAQYRSKGALCIAYAMDDNEVIASLKEDYCMIGSDDAVYTEGGANSHPRGSGTFARVIGRYSRDLDTFSMLDAVQKMTINSAKHLEEVSPAMKVRGRLREGYIADITVFDYFNINDRSTGKNPAVTSAGIPYVMVSGQTVLDRGKLYASARSGKPIKGIFSK